MTGGEDGGSPRSRRVLATLLQLLAHSVLAWTVAALLAGAVTIWLAGPYRLRFAQTAIVVGCFWLIAGGSLLGRMTTLSYQGWGVHVRGRDLLGDTTSSRTSGGLTGFGVSILVGPQLVVAGAVLLA